MTTTSRPFLSYTDLPTPAVHSRPAYIPQLRIGGGSGGGGGSNNFTRTNAPARVIAPTAATSSSSGAVVASARPSTSAGSRSTPSSSLITTTHSSASSSVSGSVSVRPSSALTSHRVTPAPASSAPFRPAGSASNEPLSHYRPPSAIASHRPISTATPSAAASSHLPSSRPSSLLIKSEPVIAAKIGSLNPTGAPREAGAAPAVYGEFTPYNAKHASAAFTGDKDAAGARTPQPAYKMQASHHSALRPKHKIKRSTRPTRRSRAQMDDDGEEAGDEGDDDEDDTRSVASSASHASRASNASSSSHHSSSSARDRPSSSFRGASPRHAAPEAFEPDVRGLETVMQVTSETSRAPRSAAIGNAGKDVVRKRKPGVTSKPASKAPSVVNSARSTTSASSKSHSQPRIAPISTSAADDPFNTDAPASNRSTKSSHRSNASHASQASQHNSSSKRITLAAAAPAISSQPTITTATTLSSNSLLLTGDLSHDMALLLEKAMVLKEQMRVEHERKMREEGDAGGKMQEEEKENHQEDESVMPATDAAPEEEEEIFAQDGDAHGSEEEEPPQQSDEDEQHQEDSHDVEEEEHKETNEADSTSYDANDLEPDDHVESHDEAKEDEMKQFESLPVTPLPSDDKITPSDSPQQRKVLRPSSKWLQHTLLTTLPDNSSLWGNETRTEIEGLEEEAGMNMTMDLSGTIREIAMQNEKKQQQQQKKQQPMKDGNETSDIDTEIDTDVEREEQQRARVPFPKIVIDSAHASAAPRKAVAPAATAVTKDPFISTDDEADADDHTLIAITPPSAAPSTSPTPDLLNSTAFFIVQKSNLTPLCSSPMNATSNPSSSSTQMLSTAAFPVSVHVSPSPGATMALASTAAFPVSIQQPSASPPAPVTNAAASTKPSLPLSSPSFASDSEDDSHIDLLANTSSKALFENIRQQVKKKENERSIVQPVVASKAVMSKAAVTVEEKKVEATKPSSTSAPASEPVVAAPVDYLSVVKRKGVQPLLEVDRAKADERSQALAEIALHEQALAALKERERELKRRRSEINIGGSAPNSQPNSPLPQQSQPSISLPLPPPSPSSSNVSSSRSTLSVNPSPSIPSSTNATVDPFESSQEIVDDDIDQDEEHEEAMDDGDEVAEENVEDEHDADEHDEAEDTTEADESTVDLGSTLIEPKPAAAAASASSDEDPFA